LITTEKKKLILMDVFTLELGEKSFDLNIHLLDKKSRDLIMMDLDEQMTTFELHPQYCYIFCGYKSGNITIIHNNNENMLKEVRTSLEQFGFDF